MTNFVVFPDELFVSELEAVEVVRSLFELGLGFSKGSLHVALFSSVVGFKTGDLCLEAFILLF